MQNPPDVSDNLNIEQAGPCGDGGMEVGKDEEEAAAEDFHPRHIDQSSDQLAPMLNRPDVSDDVSMDQASPPADGANNQNMEVEKQQEEAAPA